MNVAQPAVANFLRNISLFAGLPDAELERLIAMGQQVDLQPGQVLIQEGDPGDALYIILEGEFEVTKLAGTSETVIARRGSGEVIGEMSLMDNEPRSATVRALTGARLLKIDQKSFDALLAWSPAAARAVLRTVVSRLRNTELMLRQQEKMAALGTLAAGVAHELNNPAAAAKRGAAQLATELAELEHADAAFDSLGMDAARRAAFLEWRSKVMANAPHVTRLDPLTRSDLETKVQDWLESHQVNEAWQVAPRMVGLGLDRERLDELAKMSGPSHLSIVLQWLAARASLESLIEEVASSAERISTIVKAVKSYSYLDQAPVQQVDIHEGLENTLVILRYKLKQGVTLEKHYSPDLPKIQAYASELNQVWTNIIDNAIDAMKGHGVIKIHTYAEGERLVVEICDNGPGIPPDIQARIFEPFFTTKPVGQGTGLGLHISYSIVTVKHHGTIRVDSRPGATCFKVALPLRLDNHAGSGR